jgi:hypothetical protein
VVAAVLEHQPLCGQRRRHRRDRVDLARVAAEEDAEERRAPQRRGLGLLLRGELRHGVTLRRVTDLVPHHARQLVFRLGGADEPGVHVEVAAWNREGVHLGALDRVERVIEFRQPVRRDDPLADTPNVVDDRRVS